MVRATPGGVALKVPLLVFAVSKVAVPVLGVYSKISAESKEKYPDVVNGILQLEEHEVVCRT